MEYNYPASQGHFYSIRTDGCSGYISPMSLTFKEALDRQRTPRGLSLGKVALGAGVSVHILKNINQGKSDRPNAEAAQKIAEFFGVTLAEFYSGVVRLDADHEATRDFARLSALVARLTEADYQRVEAFAEALSRTEADLQDE